MLKSELIKILKSKRRVGFIMFMFSVPFFDLILNMIITYADYWLHKEAYVDGLHPTMIFHPANGSFLSGSSIGHIPQIILIWLMPIYLMIIYSDFYIKELQNGYNSIVLNRIEKKKFIQGRFFLSFSIPFFISFISLMTNFLFAQLLFHSGTNMSGLEFIPETKTFISWCIHNPNLAYIGYIIMYSLVVGGCGVVCTGISYLIPNDRVAYALAFLIWIIQIMSPYSLTYVMQPFIEYGPEYFLPALIVFVIIVGGIHFIAYKYKVRADEI